MRREDKEVTDRAVIDDIINGSTILRLGLCRDNKPYVVPLSFGYDGKDIYFHSAREGMKSDYIRANPSVCFEVEDKAELVKHDAIPCKFDFLFRSVIGFGEISEIIDKDEKKDALKILLKHYSDEEWSLPDAAIGGVCLWKIRITDVTGKQSKDRS